MSTDAIGSTAPATGTTGSSAALAGLNKSLDKDAFLKLLITQMQNQDPMNPMDSKDSIAQLAQFSSLEQMQQMNSSFTKFGDTFATSSQATQAYALTGSWVDYNDPNHPGTTATGKVDGVSFENGVAKLKIGSASVDLSAVTKVYPGYGAIGQNRASASAISLINQSMTYIDPTTGAVKTGTVKDVSFANGWPKLNIDGQLVDMSMIVGIPDATDQTGVDDVTVVTNSLQGKTIEYRETADSTTTFKGVVTGVDTSSTMPRLKVGSTLVDLSNVLKVSSPVK